MLQMLRENTGNWIIKIFLGIIVIVFVFLGVGSFNSSNTNSVASVNDIPISFKEYQDAYKAIVEQLRARFGQNLNDDIIEALNVKQQALDSIIEQKLILAEADKLEISVSQQELQTQLLSIKAFQKDGVFNMEQYKKVLSLNSLNPEIFETNQIHSIRQDKVRNMILSTVNVSDLEARSWYLQQNTKIKVDYVTFSPEDYSEISPDENQIRDFFNENKDKYKSEPQLKVSYLKFSPEDYSEDVAVNEENIKAYYEQNSEKYKVPEKVEARHILFKLVENADDATVAAVKKKASEVYEMAVNGENFEELAKKYSEGPSKDDGGYVGKFEKQMMVKPFADAAFSLGVDEISEPVQTVFGWHIIKLISKTEASIQSLETVSQQIKTLLQTQESTNQAYYSAGEAFDAVIDGDDFEQVALIANKKILSTPSFSASGEGLTAKDAALFARTAFELESENISDVKEIGDSYYLIKIDERISPAIQDYEVVSEKVKTDLISKLQKEKANAEALAYLELAKNEKTLDISFSNTSKKIETTPFFTRDETVENIGNSPTFVKSSFSLSQNQMIYSDLVETEKGYCIIGFNEKKLPTPSDIDENLESVKKEIGYRKQTKSYQDWVAQLKKQAEISYDPQLLN